MTDWFADPESYAANARFNVDLAGPVLDLLGLRHGERVIDLGCGDGALTAMLASRGAEVTGVDSSAEMVAATRRRGVPAVRCDVVALPSDLGPVDAVFSNAALHWVTDAGAVIDGVRSVLRPGGRFVAELGGFGNVASFRVAATAVFADHGTGSLPDWYFPTGTAYAALLTARGFDVDHCELVPRPTLLPTGVRGWFETFVVPPDGPSGPAGTTTGMTTGTTTGSTETVLDDLERRLAPVARDEAGGWWADYVRLRVRAMLRA